ncbi:hypothetical protein LINGRAHAP2_LOCUS7399 [Linum grandiflorum]
MGGRPKEASPVGRVHPDVLQGFKVAGTTRNRGRKFLRCPFWQNRRADCTYFKWVDETTTVVDRSLFTSGFTGNENQNEAQPRGEVDENQLVLENLGLLLRKVELVEWKVSCPLPPRRNALSKTDNDPEAATKGYRVNGVFKNWQPSLSPLLGLETFGCEDKVWRLWVF